MRTDQIKNVRRARRSKRVRTQLRRVSDLPRLSIHRSLKHISAQIIDDVGGRTLAHVTTTGKEIADTLKGKTKTQRAAAIGAEIARRAKEQGIQAVVFDRGFARYHGRVKALADAAREGGLKF
jgi:large subunit ribosomal protein L18